MTQIADTLSTVRQAADLVGLSEFARIAGVPYTTVKSFSDRGWKNKNLETFQKLSDAAAKIHAEQSKAA